MDVLNLLSPEAFVGIASQALQSQVAQFGIAFSFAAWIHSGRVKKEIGLQLGGIKDALTSLLKVESERITKLEKRMELFESFKHTQGEN